VAALARLLVAFLQEQRLRKLRVAHDVVGRVVPSGTVAGFALDAPQRRLCVRGHRRVTSQAARIFLLGRREHVHRARVRRLLPRSVRCGVTALASIGANEVVVDDAGRSSDAGRRYQQHHNDCRNNNDHPSRQLHARRIATTAGVRYGDDMTLDLFVVGLTGGIGSGKSAVGRMLRERGLPVIDADQLAREAVAVGTHGLAQIVAHFGSGVVHDDGSLNREALSSIVFRDLDERRCLNAIVHPEVARLFVEALEALRARGERIAVYEVPLLFESQLQEMFGCTILVACPFDMQLKRVLARDRISEEQARARIASQMALDAKRKLATFVIDNTGSLDDLAVALNGVWLDVERLASP
jgi:dephospho-CoA kinase